MSSENKEDIIEQIQKIMRLATRAGTDGEKIAAEFAMQRLADKHGINLENIKATDSDVKAISFLDDTYQTIPVMELAYITSVLRQHFGIILIQHKDGRRVKCEWVGVKINIEIAKHVTLLLLRSCIRDWRNARMAKSLAKSLVNAPGYHDPQKQMALVALTKLNKRAFMDGWFWTIHQKINEHPLRNDREQFEAEKRSAEEMFNKIKEERKIKDKKDEGRKASELDRKSVMMGYESAQAVNLSRPCSGSATSPLALK